MKKPDCQTFLKMLQELRLSRFGYPEPPRLKESKDLGNGTDKMWISTPRFSFFPLPGILFLCLMVFTFLDSAWAGQATLSWNQNTESDLSGYKIYYGTNPITTTPYTTSIDVGLTSTPNSPQHTVTGLADGMIYYFSVTAYDTSLNESSFSGEVFKQITDTAPPVISSINAGNITATATDISWITDEGATSAVEYGTTTAYGSFTAFDSILVTSHSQGLSGLSASTLYHYRVRSIDLSGNEAISGDNTFSTSASSDITNPVISSISINNITDTSATISWTTDELATSRVDYGLDTSYSQTPVSNSSPTTSHSLTLTNLIPGTIYNYRVRSTDASGNEAISGDYLFTTLDTSPPAISAITVSNITDGSATISWTTNELAAGRVDYGLDTSYSQAPVSNSSPTTSHSLTLTGLSPATTYYFQVRSTDSSGNESIDGPYNFVTSAVPDITPPVISAITVTSITATSATIAWITNEPATNQVNYGLTSSLGTFTFMNATLANNHSQTMEGLLSGVSYFYQVISQDATGNPTASQIQQFTTLSVSDTTPPSDISEFQALPRNQKVNLSWRNPADSDFQGVRIRYRTDGQFPTGVADGSLLGDFTGKPSEVKDYLHANLINGTTYFYAAFAYDSSSNFTNAVFITATPEGIDDDNKSDSVFGCGAVRNVGSGGNTPPFQGDLALLAAIMIWFGFARKTFRKLPQILFFR